MNSEMRFWGLGIIIMCVFLVLGFWLVPQWNQYFQTPEQRIKYLHKSIWCPICEGETVATSQTEISKKLRNEIRRMVNEGKSNHEIYSYVEDNYGKDNIAVPRTGWIKSMSYGFPYILIALLTVAAFRVGWLYSESDDTTDAELDDSEIEKVEELVESSDSPLR